MGRCVLARRWRQREPIKGCYVGGGTVWGLNWGAWSDGVARVEGMVRGHWMDGWHGSGGHGVLRKWKREEKGRGSPWSTEGMEERREGKRATMKY